MTDLFAGGSAACSCSSAARCRRSGSGGSREASRPGGRDPGGAAGCGASPAAATNECRGLQVVRSRRRPVGGRARRRSRPATRVEYQLSCPRGYVVGGLDAELTRPRDRHRLPREARQPGRAGRDDRALGVFRATYIGSCAARPSFRPHIWVASAAAGGGSGPVPYSRPVVVPARESRPFGGSAPCASARDSVRASSRRAAPASGSSRRWHAIGVLHDARPPSAALIQSVSATRSVQRRPRRSARARQRRGSARRARGRAGRRSLREGQ